MPVRCDGVPWDWVLTLEAVCFISKMVYPISQDIVSYQQKSYIMQLLSSRILHFHSALKRVALVLLILRLANNSGKAGLAKL